MDVGDAGEVGSYVAFEKRPVKPKDRIRSLTRGLRKVADKLELVAVVAAILGAAGGMVLMFQTGEDGYDTTHPYVGLGLAVVLTSLVGGMFNWCVARTMHVFAEHTAASHSIDLGPLP